jgi:hypothetical protein
LIIYVCLEISHVVRELKVLVNEPSPLSTNLFTSLSATCLRSSSSSVVRSPFSMRSSIMA